MMMRKQSPTMLTAMCRRQINVVVLYDFISVRMGLGSVETHVGLGVLAKKKKKENLVSSSFCILALGPILTQVVNIPKGRQAVENQCRDEIIHEAIKLEMMGEENMAFPSAGEESDE
jgi:hypothetical protein